MTNDITYKDYVYDDAHMKDYSEYQNRYAKTIRESDKVLIEIIRNLAAVDLKRGKRPALLDIGCSTGNLLLHLKHTLPGLELWGGDMAPGIIAECQNNPPLQGIQFEEMNVLDISYKNQFDFIIANVMLFALNNEEFDAAFTCIGTALQPKGWLVVFDLIHPFEQEITIIEKSKLHPKGLKLHFRGYSRVKDSLKKAGFSNPDFKPFHIPIDLKRPSEPADITSYTIQSVDGQRMSFRGTLFQPWCHLVAQKSG